MSLPLSFAKEKELPLPKVLIKALKLLEFKKYFKKLTRYLSYPDEPQYWKYEVEFLTKNDQKTPRFSGGFSWQREKALIKALGEAMERFCLASFDQNNFVTGSYNDLKKKDLPLNPTTVVSFSKNQRRTLSQKYRFNHKTPFQWVKGFSLVSDQPVFIPAQLVFVPYKIKEARIRRPISTGAACWSTLAGAIYQGICEIVERDAYLITYLNRLPRAKIKLSNTQNPLINEMASAFKRYHLNLYVIETTTDIDIPSMMAIIVDRTSLGPAVIVGLRANLDPEKAIIGAIEEAQHIRHWIRGKMKDKSPTTRHSELVSESQHPITKTSQRSLLWSRTKNIAKLDFLLKNPHFKNISEIRNRSSKNALTNLKTALSFFKKLNLEVFYVDITQPEIADLGFKVVKIVIPALQPLYIRQPPGYHGGKRLYQVPKVLGYAKKETKEENLNDFPHPFH